jgi:hypothetical protein
MGALAATQDKIPLPGYSRTPAALVTRVSDFGEQPDDLRQEETNGDQLRVEEVEGGP